MVKAKGYRSSFVVQAVYEIGDVGRLELDQGGTHLVVPALVEHGPDIGPNEPIERFHPLTPSRNDGSAGPAAIRSGGRGERPVALPDY